MPKPRDGADDRGIRFERAAYFSLSLPSRSVSLVQNRGGRSVQLPTSCDVCQKFISDYPFVTKHGMYGKDRLARHRKYHLACALSVGLVSLVPAKL